MRYLAGIFAFLVLFRAGLSDDANAIAGAGLSAEKASAGDGPTSQGCSACVAQGEVKKLDKDLGKVVLKHGPLPHLRMPAMTMVFKVREPVQLTGLQVGDGVEFLLERVNGTLMVTKIQASK
jgi:Cu(I)/Ag(I) efflux system protein CusF